MKKLFKIFAFILIITAAIIFFNKDKEAETIMDAAAVVNIADPVEMEIQLDSASATYVDNSKNLEDFQVLVDLVDTFISEHEKSQNDETIIMLTKLKGFQNEYKALIKTIEKSNTIEFNRKIDRANTLREEILDTLDDISIIEHDS